MGKLIVKKTVASEPSIKMGEENGKTKVWIATGTTKTGTWIATGATTLY